MLDKDILKSHAALTITVICLVVALGLAIPLVIIYEQSRLASIELEREREGKPQRQKDGDKPNRRRRKKKESERRLKKPPSARPKNVRRLKTLPCKPWCRWPARKTRRKSSNPQKGLMPASMRSSRGMC